MQLDLDDFERKQYEDRISSLEGDLELSQAEVRMQERTIEELREGLEDLHSVLDEIHHDSNVGCQTPDDQLDKIDKILCDIRDEAASALRRVKI